MAALTPDLVAGFARAALANVRREYPRKLDHLLQGPPDDLTPRKVHPAFYGSYDWHSAVHMHWLLVRLMRHAPDPADRSAIEAVLDAHLTAENLATEQAYFKAPGRGTFERPYGWAWALELQAEALRLAAGRPDVSRWSRALAPLARDLAERMRGFLAVAAYPIRNGMHGNTAFACLLALDYARVAGDAALAAAIEEAARRWYLADRDAPVAYEPSLADFLSPTLIEAQLMRELLPRGEFAAWIEGFLPAGLGPLATPPIVPDRRDAQFSHLDGLSLSRAWALTRIAPATTGVLAQACVTAAALHLRAGLPQVVGGDYVGEHWLASFAALALSDTP